MKIAHIRHALAKALDDFKGGEASATHVLSAIEALIEEKNTLQQERPSFADWTSDYVRDNLHKLKPQPVRQDTPDLIAGALGVSRGTAYDLMREALAEQPAQRHDPVAVLLVGQDSDGRYVSIAAKAYADTLPLGEYKLYTSPPAQRTWVGLTQDEFRDFASTLEYGTGGLIRAIEAKLKEKNT